jgi:hypothetical protein
MKGYVQLKNYDGLYYINKRGIIKNKEGVTIRPFIHEDGNLRITLYKNERKRNHYIHRLVCRQWVPNPLRLKEVVHVNRDRKDNRVSNLRWCTRQTNDLNRDMD